MVLDLAEVVKQAGVVGAGGGGFPTHIKLQSQNIDYVIANGVECEPLLSADRLLITEYAAEIVQGLSLMKTALGAKTAIIALKEKNQKAIMALKTQIEKAEIDIHLLPDVYPLGDEQVLIYDITGRVVPPGGLPLDVGVVVNNVATVFQVAKAFSGEPFTHRLVTITGYVESPMTVRLPIGLSIKESIQIAGGVKIADYAVLKGGPMMGQVVTNLEEPVSKTTSGLIVLPKDHPLILERERDIRQMIKRSQAVCCRCEKCTQICPRSLLGHGLKPHKIMRAISHNLADPELQSAYLCSECGLCIYGCDMGLSPRKINQAVKAELKKAGIKNQPDRSKVNPQTMRQYRQIPKKRLAGRFAIQDLLESPPWGQVNSTPKYVKIPLLQHFGAPTEPIVKVGDQVDLGQLIGQVPEGKLGAVIHASIAGQVVQIDEYIHIQAS